MSEQAQKGVIDRLERLEQECGALRRQLRTWKRVAATVVLAGTMASLLAGARDADDDPKTLRIGRLILLGRNGRVHAELAVSKNVNSGAEFPELTFFDQNTHRRAELGLDTNGNPSLGFRDKNEASRFTASVRQEDDTRLSFFDGDGWGQLVVYATTRGSGLKLLGPDEKGRGGADHGGLLVAEDGSTKLHFFTPGPVRGKVGTERVALEVRKDGTPRLKLTGKMNEPLFQAPEQTRIVRPLQAPDSKPPG